MHPVLTSISLLILSNVFMTFAWYAHLKELSVQLNGLLRQFKV